MPFILNEDAALKSLLSGITVSDGGNASRPVAVYYGQPDKELRQQSYPYITVDLVGIREDTSRAHRGYGPISYLPDTGVTLDPNTQYNTGYPIPVDLIYQVSTWARQPRHDRQIIASLLSFGRLPLRFGQLYVPQDNTVRRLDVLGFSKRDSTEQDKRLFSNVFNLRISAEIFENSLDQMYKVLHNPHITFTTQTSTFTS
jgi:hypothetical protein